MILIIIYSLKKFDNQDVKNVSLYVSLYSNLKRHKKMVHMKEKKHFCQVCVNVDPETGISSLYGCYTKQDIKRHYETQEHQRRVEMARHKEMQDHQRRIEMFHSQAQIAYPVAQPFNSGINSSVSSNVQGLKRGCMRE